MSRAVLAAYLACSLIWGTTWFAIRVSIAPDAYSTLVALALRFAIAFLLMLPLALRARPWPRGSRAWGYLVLAGVLDAIAYTLVYYGEERIPGGLAAVVYGTQPLILALLLQIIRVETISKRHVIGALISLAGVGVLFLDRLDVSSSQAIGVALVVGSVVAATGYSMVMKSQPSGIVPTTVFIGVTAAVIGVAALASRAPLPWPPPLAPTIALLYLAVVGTVIAFLLYFYLLDRTSLLVTSTLVFVFPLVALATDALFEREIHLTARAYVGAAVTLAGLAVSLRRR